MPLHPADDCRRPLRGRRIVVTRTRRRVGARSARLRELGAEPVEIPAIEIRPVDPAPAVAALRRGGWSWIVFTSA
ncbi:MAG: uroporphyrinogen-III synthase, partial [candidate division NC10 bacterium]|nr:uroporphyrinogen-III synthase [candidate division NC10 bacterium]